MSKRKKQPTHDDLVQDGLRIIREQGEHTLLAHLYASLNNRVAHLEAWAHEERGILYVMVPVLMALLSLMVTILVKLS